MPSLMSNLMSGRMEPERPLIDRPAGLGMPHWKPVGIHPHPNGSGIRVQVLPGERKVAEGSRQQQVGLATTLAEVPGHIEAIARHARGSRGDDAVADLDDGDFDLDEFDVAV